MRDVPFLDLSRQANILGRELQAALAEVAASGRFILGEQGQRFEQAFATCCQAAWGIGVASGTDALRLALLACEVAPGDEVLTVSHTAVATIAAICSIGAVPVVVDVDPVTYTMDPRQLAARVSPRTKAILPVHLYGQCADMGPILAIARSRGLRVIEDCAQAHGARYHGWLAGTMGDAGCYSFYPTKNLGALGDAGMVITQDAGIAERLRSLRNYGQPARDPSILRGYASRLDELQAAVLLRKLRSLGTWHARRRAIARRYLEGLADTGLRLPQEAPGREHAYHLYVIRVEERDLFQAQLSQHGIETLVHYPTPAHRHAAYAGLVRGGATVPVTERLASEVVSLPCYPELEDGEIDAVIAAVKTTVRTPVHGAR